MMVRVVISRATRVPCFSATLSTFDLHPTTYRGPDDALTITVANVSFYSFCIIPCKAYIFHHLVVSVLLQLSVPRFVML